MLTYPRIEFSANILLFVPLGVLLMLILRRRYLILPIAIVVTVAIECAQGLLLDKRTPSVLDIIANTAGACIGMLIVAVVESMRRARARWGGRPSVENEADTWAALGIVPPPAPPLPAAGTVSIAPRCGSRRDRRRRSICAPRVLRSGGIPAPPGDGRALGSGFVNRPATHSTYASDVPRTLLVDAVGSCIAIDLTASRRGR